MKVINFIGAPCAGKTTAASGLFNAMKMRYVRAELTLEAAKKHSYADTSHLLANQVQIFSEQNEMLFYLDRLHKGGRDTAVDFVISDSPILLSAVYAPDSYPESFRRFVVDMWKQYDNELIVLERNHPYDQSGRYHTEEQARAIHEKTMEMLEEEGIKYTYMVASERVPFKVLQMLGIAVWTPELVEEKMRLIEQEITELRHQQKISPLQDMILERQFSLLRDARLLTMTGDQFQASEMGLLVESTQTMVHEISGP